MLKTRLFFVGLIAALGTGNAFAQAEAPKSLGQFADWTAYSYQTTKGKSCYALAVPKEKLPKTANRDPIYLFVTNRPAEGINGEISVVNGYTFKEDSKVNFQIRSSRGNLDFMLFTKDDTAWLETAAEQPKAIDAMRRSKDIVIKGTSARGTVTTDTYSLEGISKALDKINAECK